MSPTTDPMVMTKRTLYAQLLTAVLLAVCPPAAGAQCGSCIGITIQAGQQLLLPDDLGGLTILVRVSPQSPDPLPLQTLSEIERRGGRAALLVEPSLTATVPADASYRLKSFLTQCRAAVWPTVAIALETMLSTRPLLAEFGPYVDAVVDDVPAVEGDHTALPAVALWPRLKVGTWEERAQAAAQGTYERSIIDAPSDALQAREVIYGLAERAARPSAGLVEAVEVRGRRRLSVHEIVARHQASVRRQRLAVTRTISSGTLALTFEAPGFPAPVTVTSDTAIYADAERTELSQRRIRVNGIEFSGTRVPRLPLLEAERVISPPLAIELTPRYRYRLDGEERVNGLSCYVVAFEPLDSKQVLFRGRAWIAADSFAMVKVAAVQTGLRGAIVSSEQHDEFREVSPGVWLLSTSDVRQIYEGAAHRTPIHRVLTIDTHAVDPSDFVARRDAAYASDAIMLRDTPEGYRYVRRPSQSRTDAGGSSAADLEASDSATRVRTIAAGAIVDPNISQPLPFAGLSYVDFDLFGTGVQLNGFFGGAYGQLAVSAPSVAGTRWQLGGRAFVVASSYNDRSFRGGREIYEENLRQRPAQASIWVLRPLTPRLSVRAGYALDYTHLEASPETVASFVVPADQVVHGFTLAIEGQRDGWAGSLWWNPARRSGWRSWGRATEFDAQARDFTRWGATVSRSTIVSPAVATRVEAQWASGHDLDRFSRHAFGTFDNRLRGYPSALVRYDRGFVIRSAVAWSASRRVRLDGFLDTAAVRDSGYGEGLRNYTGMGFAAEVPVPFGMLAAVEWGYGFRGVNANGDLGTQVIRISVFKVF